VEGPSLTHAAVAAAPALLVELLQGKQLVQYISFLCLLNSVLEESTFGPVRSWYSERPCAAYSGCQKCIRGCFEA